MQVVIFRINTIPVHWISNRKEGRWSKFSLNKFKNCWYSLDRKELKWVLDIEVFISSLSPVCYPRAKFKWQGSPNLKLQILHTVYWFCITFVLSLSRGLRIDRWSVKYTGSVNEYKIQSMMYDQWIFLYKRAPNHTRPNIVKRAIGTIVTITNVVHTNSQINFVSSWWHCNAHLGPIDDHKYF